MHFQVEKKLATERVAKLEQQDQHDGEGDEVENGDPQKMVEKDKENAADETAFQSFYSARSSEFGGNGGGTAEDGDFVLPAEGRRKSRRDLVEKKKLNSDKYFKK